jgi:hypothetical protein
VTWPVGMCVQVGSLAHAVTFSTYPPVPPSNLSRLQKQKDTPRVKLKPTTLRPERKQKNLYSQQTCCGLITLIPVMAPSVLDFYVNSFLFFFRCDLSSNVTGYIHDRMCIRKWKKLEFGAIARLLGSTKHEWNQATTLTWKEAQRLKSTRSVLQGTREQFLDRGTSK